MDTIMGIHTFSNLIWLKLALFILYLQFVLSQKDRRGGPPQSNVSAVHPPLIGSC
jgi:hypothetical protein